MRQKALSLRSLWMQRGLSVTVRCAKPRGSISEVLVLTRCHDVVSSYPAGVDCPVASVTVFEDRAEVTRVLRVSAVSAGDLQIAVRGFPECLDTQSVRVDACPGVTLQEVSYEQVQTPSIPSTQRSAELRELTQQRNDVQEEVETLRNREKELLRSQTLLTSYVWAPVSAWLLGCGLV